MGPRRILRSSRPQEIFQPRQQGFFSVHAQLQLHGNIFRIFSSYRGSSGTEFSRVVDPYSFFPDPDPIRLQDFNDQKLKKNQLIFFYP